MNFHMKRTEFNLREITLNDVVGVERNVLNAWSERSCSKLEMNSK